MGRINSPMSSNRSNQRGSLLLGNILCDTNAPCPSHIFTFFSTSELIAICSHCFSPPTLCRAFYSRTKERPASLSRPSLSPPSSTALTPNCPAPSPTWTAEINSFWTSWSSCKHWQNQWDFHTGGWGTLMWMLLIMSSFSETRSKYRVFLLHLCIMRHLCKQPPLS